MSLITENNRQYYEGAQGFRGDGTTVSFTTTFNTDLEWYAASDSDINYTNNNFKLYSSSNGLPGSWSEVTTGYTVSGNTITYTGAPVNNLYIVAQLKRLDGGNYGNTYAEKAVGETVEKNYGSYAYTKLNDIINNFIVAYVGAGNFHEGTAHLYTDHALLTSDKRITSEVDKVFDFLKHQYKTSRYKHLLVSPNSTRRSFLAYIQKE